MVLCGHKLCKGKFICGQIVGDTKNPGGNIYNMGDVYIHKRHKVYGWHSLAESNFYKALVNKVKNGIIVEIGVYGGVSLLGVVETCQKNNNHIYGIDPWENINTANGQQMSNEQKKTYREIIKSVRLNLENIVKFEGYNKTVTLISDFSKNAVSQFKNGSIDVIFIDGDHSYKSVYEDLNIWFPKIKKDGVIWGDDFNWKSVQLAVKDFCKIKNIKLRQICDGRAWTIKRN